MSFAILGGHGQLGQQFARVLGDTAVVLSRAEFDITRDADKLLHIAPRVVINCAAWNAVDQAEDDWQSALAVNAWGLADIARACAALDAVLVHVSTDYVFSGAKCSPHVESDDPAPVNLYGVSKWAGEQVVRALWHKHIIVRTCGLYGAAAAGKPNFVHTMLRLANEGKPIRVVSDQVCTPTSVVDLAPAILRLVERQAYGLFHLTNAGGCSWFEFASALFEIRGMKVDLAPCVSADFPRRARRPAYSVLENRAYNALGLPPLRGWSEALADFLGG